MKTLVDETQSNWQLWRTLAICVQLTLHAYNFADTARECLEVLKTAREKAYNWLCAIQDELSNAEGESQYADMCSRSTEVALVCITTFDIHTIDLEQILREEYDAEA